MKTAETVDDIFPNLSRHPLVLWKEAEWVFGYPGDTTLRMLCGLVHEGYKRVFEFGTFTGRTACNLYCNGAQVVTIDNGDQSGPYGVYELNWWARDLAITCLVGDSRAADLLAFYDKIDLVFIDGGHTYETVRSDTEQAGRLLRPGGIIVWDDYNDSHPGVVRAVNEFDLANREAGLTLLVHEGVVVHVGSNQ